MQHQPRSVRRDFYGYRASITHHPQGEPPELGNRTFDKPNPPSPAGRSRAPAHPGGAVVTAHSGLDASSIRDLVSASKKDLAKRSRRSYHLEPVTGLVEELAERPSLVQSIVELIKI
jgi:hypothetical protein